MWSFSRVVSAPHITERPDDQVQGFLLLRLKGPRTRVASSHFLRHLGLFHLTTVCTSSGGDELGCHGCEPQCQPGSCPTATHMRPHSMHTTRAQR